MKKCPYCAEEIQDEAIKCRFCGSMLAGAPPAQAGTTFGTPGFDTLRPEVERLLGEKKKIEAVKLVREKKGCGLMEAKAYVDAVQEGRNPEAAFIDAKSKKGGCGASVVSLIAAAIFLGAWFALITLW